MINLNDTFSPSRFDKFIDNLFKQVDQFKFIVKRFYNQIIYNVNKK